jgi:hypothetical protein
MPLSKAKVESTYAPPELSEPAITSTRPWTMMLMFFII